MYTDKRGNGELKQLFQAVLSLKERKDCYAFFYDLLSVNELETYAQRFEVARMLREEHTYSEIRETTQASTTTISRVKNCLNYGNGGYHMILDRMEVRNEK